jgi:hypothetical protein
MITVSYRSTCFIAASFVIAAETVGGLAGRNIAAIDQLAGPRAWSFLTTRRR